MGLEAQENQSRASLADTSPSLLKTAAVSDPSEVAKLVREFDAAHSGLDAHAMILVTALDGTILDVNENFCELTGFTHEELVGTDAAEHVAKPRINELRMRVAEKLHSGYVWQGDLSGRTKAGKRYWVNATIVPIVDESDNVVRVLTIQTDITERRRSQQEAKQIAFFDQVTGLPNRASLLCTLRENLDAGVEGERYCALMTVSIDGFSSTNFALGFAKGDELIRQIATRLSDCDHRIQLVTRIGPSVFGLYAPMLSQQRADALRQIEEITVGITRELSNQSWLGGEISVDTTARIGAVLIEPQEMHADEYLRRAEVARSHAKRQDEAPAVVIFSDALFAEARERVATVSELRKGIRRDELRLFYQPIVDSELRPVGYEGVVRWDRPAHGLVQPHAFIPLAEQTGLILDIGAWVFEEAVRKLQAWADDARTADLTLSVNLSEKQLRRGDFVRRTLELLETNRIDPLRLKFEITESIAQSDIAHSIRAMRALGEHGVHFALDDFGTGYSSLSYLKTLPVQQLKIDRVFTSEVACDDSQAAIVRAIVSLADALDLEVVAEGVETQAQFDRLRELGVGLFQGFLFGAPAPSELVRA